MQKKKKTHEEYKKKVRGGLIEKLQNKKKSCKT